MKHRIRVTAKDINDCPRLKHPLAQAIERCKAFAGRKVLIGYKEVTIGPKDFKAFWLSDPSVRRFALPGSAQHFSRLFFGGCRQLCKPFTFTLEV